MEGVGFSFSRKKKETAKDQKARTNQHQGIAKMRGRGGNFCGIRSILFGSILYAVQCRTAAMRVVLIFDGRQNETPLSAPQAADGVSFFAVCEAFFLFTADFFFLSRKKEKRPSKFSAERATSEVLPWPAQQKGGKT